MNIHFALQHKSPTCTKQQQPQINKRTQHGFTGRQQPVTSQQKVSSKQTSLHSPERANKQTSQQLQQPRSTLPNTSSQVDSTKTLTQNSKHLL